MIKRFLEETVLTRRIPRPAIDWVETESCDPSSFNLGLESDEVMTFVEMRILKFGNRALGWGAVSSSETWP